MQANLDEITRLVGERLVSRQQHRSLPLSIYNYTARAQHTPPSEWSKELAMCRGLILDQYGGIVGRPFDKFWNYEQSLQDIPPQEAFTVWEKLDGSLGIVCAYRDQLVVATRGSFESEQAQWARTWLGEHPFSPDGQTFLFEIVYPANRIVVDYGERAGLILLAVMNPDGTEDPDRFQTAAFDKARRFDGVSDFSRINAMPELQGQEGFVVRWDSGFRAKLKLEEYKRLHRLITQCSTRTIWELLRAGKPTDELIERTPADFREWVTGQINGLTDEHRRLTEWAITTKNQMNSESRKEFAEAAKATQHPGLLFLLLDGRDISDAAWKAIEPKWACPFKKDEG